MDRSSRSIKLAFLGSAVFLAGCKAENDEAARQAALKRQQDCELAKKQGRDCPPATTHTTAHRSGVGFVPIVTGSRTTSVPSGGSVSTGASARGGFGATGAATSSAAS